MSASEKKLDKPNELKQAEVIQAVLPGDIEEARRLFVEYGTSLGFSLCFQNFDKELKELPGCYVPPSGRLLLAKAGGEMGGCIALRGIDRGICEMKRLYVRPAYRGRGLGRLMVDRLISEARSIGYERMRLDTIQSAMKEAIALYRRIGFLEIEPYSSVPIESAMWMELRL